MTAKAYNVRKARASAASRCPVHKASKPDYSKITKTKNAPRLENFTDS